MTNHHFQFKMTIIFVIHRSVDWFGSSQKFKQIFHLNIGCYVNKIDVVP